MTSVAKLFQAGGKSVCVCVCVCLCVHIGAETDFLDKVVTAEYSDE